MTTEKLELTEPCKIMPLTLGNKEIENIKPDPYYMLHITSRLFELMGGNQPRCSLKK